MKNARKNKKPTPTAFLESEKQWRLLYENLPGGSYIVNRQCRIEDVNEALCELTGFSHEELIGQHCSIICPKGPHQCPIFDLGRERLENLEGAIKAKDGRLIPILKNARKITLPDQEIIIENFLDYRKQKNTEEALDRERKQLLSIFDSIDEIVYVSDPTTHEILFVNRFIRETFGKDLVGGICYRELQHRDRPCEFCTNEIILKQKPEPYRWEYHNPVFNRDYLVFDRIIQWSDGRDVRFELAIDITERIRAEKESRQFKACTDHANYAVAMADLHGRILYVNPTWARMHGYAPKELLAKPLSIFHRNEELDKVKRLNRQLMEKGQYLNEEVEHRKKDGSLFPMLMNGILFKDEKEVPQFIFATAVDITDRKHAKEALEALLHEREERIKELQCMYGVAEAIRACDTQEKIFRAAVALFPTGWQYPEITRVKIVFDKKEYVRQPFKETPWKQSSDVVVDGKPRGKVEVFYMEERPERDEGAFLKEERNLIDGIARTLGEVITRWQAENALAASRKQLRALAARLESVREQERTDLAREIHDVLGHNLTGLKLDTARLQRRMKKEKAPHGKDLLDRMTSMTDALDRTIAFVRSLGTRLRPGVLDFGLPEAIEWQADEFQHRTGIQCKILSKPETLAISEDRSTAVFRIFQEILTNIARHADASGVKIRLHQQGNHLVLQVTDNGKGIREGAMHQPGHFGILGMRERALTFGGEVIIKPAPKKGTGVRVKIPIRRNKNEHSDCR